MGSASCAWFVGFRRSKLPHAPHRAWNVQCTSWSVFARGKPVHGTMDWREILFPPFPQTPLLSLTAQPATTTYYQPTALYPPISPIPSTAYPQQAPVLPPTPLLPPSHLAATTHRPLTAHPATSFHPAATAHPAVSFHPAAAAHPVAFSHPAATAHPAATSHPVTSMASRASMLPPRYGSNIDNDLKFSWDLFLLDSFQNKTLKLITSRWHALNALIV